jgi:Fe-S cluster assembly iron-binding protein IscA
MAGKLLRLPSDDRKHVDRGSPMIIVTKRAAALLKAVKAADGATNEAGIRIRRGLAANESGISVGFEITEEPNSDDRQFEQQGVRFFVEDALVEPLDGRTLDVLAADQGLELVWR